MLRVMLRFGSVGLGAIAFLLLGAAPSQTTLITQIIALENGRSLGNGQLAAFLGAGNETVAVRAALALGRTKLPAAEAPLAAHLHDDRVAVRAMSVYALGLLATGKEVTPLVRALKDPSGAVRVAALDALGRYEAAGKLGAEEVTVASAIIMILQRDSNATVRAQAATALAAFAESSAAESATRALESAEFEHSNARLRHHAIAALDRGYVKFVSRAFLARAVRDRDEIVRIEAAKAIGRAGHADEIGLLTPLLRDPSWRVQEQAAEALRQLRKEPLTQHWTQIPAFIHTPKRSVDALAGLPALARDSVSDKPSAPTAAQAILKPMLDPTTAYAMTHPAPGPHPRVRLVTTQGNVYVTLYPEWAPLTVANFLNLVNAGYYDDNRWFRIVPDFVVQTGDKTNTGNGDPGFSIGAEENPLGQHSGVISMGLNYNDKTNTPIRDSAGSQYYITLSPQPHLNRDFTVFGAVSSGFNVLGRLTESDDVLRIERIRDAQIPSTPTF